MANATEIQFNHNQIMALTLLELLNSIWDELSEIDVHIENDKEFTSILDQIELNTGEGIRELIIQAYNHLLSNEDYKFQFPNIKKIGYMINAIDIKKSFN